MVAPLQLAYLGDAVCSLYVREYLLHHTTLATRKLHSRSIGMVSATAQAAALHYMEEGLPLEEADIVRRGKGADGHPPKSCDRATYRAATAFEALLGYLQLTGQVQRLDQLMAQAIAYWEDDHAENNA